MARIPRIGIGGLLWVVLVIGGLQLRGQAVYGSISATILDPSGAAVPGAKIGISDLGRDVSYSGTSSESGYFSQTHLFIGDYRIRIEAPGFKPHVQDVTVAVDTVVNLEVVLQPGDITEHVEVRAETPMLKTERTDVATTISERVVLEIPTLSRNFSELMLLTPGTVQFNWNDTSTENPQGGIAVNVNGQHFTGVGYSLDGTDNRDFLYGNMIVVPNLDSVVQAKVTSANFDAEFGQAQAGVVSTSTKSGTNDYHGTAFFFRRNDLTQARDPFSQSVPIDSSGRLLPQALWSQFGGSFSGRILKNRTFFFVDYQGTRAKDAGSALLRVPTAAERTGDLSALAQDSGQNIFDPAGGATPAERPAFVGNVIPASRVSQPALKLVNLLPLPNITGVGPGDPNYAASGSDKYNGDSFNIRVDHFQTQKLRIFGRYTFTKFLKEAPGAFGAVAGGPQLNNIGYVGRGDTQPQSLAAGFDYTLSPRVLTDFRFGWYKQPIDVLPLATGSFAQDAGALGLNFTNDPTTLSMPHFGIGGGYALGGFDFGYSLYNNCNCPLIERMQQFQYANNWSFMSGNHTYKVGADIRHLQNLRVPSDQHRSGELYFTSDRTRGPNGGGLGLASYLIGDVSNFQRYVSNSLDAGERQNREFFYAQDTWRVTPKLTLNYGLRWEIYNPQTVTGVRKGGWLNIDTGEIMVAGENGVGLNGNVENSYTNLAPRLGIAYQLTSKTVARLGYGRTFDVGTFGSIFGHSVTQNLPVLGIQQLTPANDFESVFNLGQGPPFLDINTVLDSQPKGPNGNHLLPAGIRSFLYPKKMRLATLDAWNFSVQHQLSSSITLEAAYVANKGTHVFAGEGPDYDPNQPTLVGFAQGLSTDQRKPFYNKFGWTQGLRYFGNDADNHYNSLQTKVEKRFSKGYSVLAHYTFSHAKNHESAYYPIDSNVNYGRPEWQRNHVFVLVNLFELPFGRGKPLLGQASRGLDMVVGGWELSSNLVWMGGQGFTVSYANCGADEDVGVCRPDLVGDYSVSNQSRDQWYKGATDVLANNGDTNGPWRRPQAGTIGNAGRNTLSGPAWFNTDMSLLKRFMLTEKLRGEFRTEAFNVFNHVNPGNPDGCVDCGTAGRIFSLAPNALMRRLQFGLRFEF